MAKKNTKAVADAAEKQAAQRLAAIREFNMNNAGDLWIDPERVPTEEEINEAKKDFEERTVALRDKKDYLIADAANALRVAKFMKTFIENAFWTQRYFVGVVNFSEYINEFITECEKEAKDLVLEYGPMQFAYLMFENYAGKGIEDAKKMVEIWDEYIPIYDTLRTHVEWYNNEVKECERLKQRWGMLSQGYYLVLLNPENGQGPVNPEDAPAKEEPATDAPVEETVNEECVKKG